MLLAGVYGSCYDGECFEVVDGALVEDGIPPGALFLEAFLLFGTEVSAYSARFCEQWAEHERVLSRASGFSARLLIVARAPGCPPAAMGVYWL